MLEGYGHLSGLVLHPSSRILNLFVAACPVGYNDVMKLAWLKGQFFAGTSRFIKIIEYKQISVALTV